VLTAVASAPKVIPEAMALLEGKKVTLDLINAVAILRKTAQSLDNADLDYGIASAWRKYIHKEPWHRAA